jgi:PAS domain S-box-containing protein
MFLRRVLVAVALAAITLFVTIVAPVLRLHAPYLVPVAGVMTAAWYAGMWAGLVTSFIIMVGVSFYMLPPAMSFRIESPDDVLRLALFAVVSLFMSAIIERGRRTAATLRATLWSIDDAVIVTDRQARVTFMNPVAERLTGWMMIEAAGRPVADVYRILDEPSREPSSSRIEGMLRDSALREGTILGPRRERLLLARSGEEYPVAESGSSVTDENGERLGAVLVFSDVSEQRASREAAERANRMKDEFLATVSHELRTPLNAVLGWTRMLRTGSMAPGAVTRAIEAVDRNADALATLVNDLLDVSRIVTGHLRLNPVPADVAQIVRDSLETLAPSFAAKRLQLASDIGGVPHLLVDTSRLRQVTWNLLTNAIKFTPPGGEIVVRVTQEEQHVVIVVSDTGQGIAPEQLPYVFNRFWQADAAPTRTVGGLGLGLAIVRHLVEAHAGSVDATSAGIGKGATFTVSLPLSAAVDVEKLPTPAAPDAAPTFSLSNVDIVAVDDELDSLDLVAEALRRRGADVRTAQSAEDALEACRTRMPDVLIADIAMPGKDGFALLRELRRDNGTATVPAIALTAYAGEEHQQAALEAGFAQHLEKPVNLDRLTLVVAELTKRALH